MAILRFRPVVSVEAGSASRSGWAEGIVLDLLIVVSKGLGLFVKMRRLFMGSWV